MTKIEYNVEQDDEYGGIPIDRVHLYEMNDTPESEQEWRKLLKEFEAKFPTFSGGHKDYGFADWHYGMRSLFVCLYNEQLYNSEFLSKIIGILMENSESYAQFECYNRSKDLIGCFMVFRDKVIFDTLSEKNGLIKALAK